MDLPGIRVFLALCEELHFGRTAERVGLSQARVSRLVHSLEDEVGGMLFKRTSRRVTLTPLGERLRDRLQPAYERLSEALADARRMAHEPLGELRIGFTATTAGTVLNRLIAAFESDYPDCEVTLSEVSISDPYAALRQGEIDVLVNWLAVEEPDLMTGPAIAYEERVLAVATDHKLAKRKAIYVNDLAGCEVARLPRTFPAALEEKFMPRATPSGVPIPRTRIAHSFGELATLVARGLIVQGTVASMAAQLAREDIVLIPIVDLPPLALGLIWRKARENKHIRALAEAARSIESQQNQAPTGH
jgi:DNA-binding transcriptional LysR family regulator